MLSLCPILKILSTMMLNKSMKQITIEVTSMPENLGHSLYFASNWYNELLDGAGVISQCLRA